MIHESDDTYETHKPTCELRWFRVESVRWSDAPLAVKYDYEGPSSYYALKQKWVSDLVGFDPEWRDIEVAL